MHWNAQLHFKNVFLLLVALHSSLEAVLHSSLEAVLHSPLEAAHCKRPLVVVRHNLSDHHSSPGAADHRLLVAGHHTFVRVVPHTLDQWKLLVLLHTRVLHEGVHLQLLVLGECLQAYEVVEAKFERTHC